MNDDNQSFFLTWLIFNDQRRRRRGGRTAPIKRLPTMPKAQWRRLAAICFAAGAVVAALLIGNDGSRTVAGAIVGGLVAVAVGMFTIETIWLRRRERVLGAATATSSESDTASKRASPPG